MTTPLLQVKDASVNYSVSGSGILFKEKRTITANDGISFDLNKGETLGVVGESGCGKSTLARAIIGLLELTSGSIIFKGDELSRMHKKQLHLSRKSMQMIFQDPLASLDPRMTVAEIIAEPLRAFGNRDRAGIRQRVLKQMQSVGLTVSQVNHYPHEFSGGQCQRIGIARALILNPQLLVCDEPVSALDVSIQAQIINLLMQLQQEMGLAILFISHDLSVVKHICHRVMVMYLGKVVEIADKKELYRQPKHPYTQALIDAIPIPDPLKQRAKKGSLLTGDLPSALNPPSGCLFRTRCPRAQQRCVDNIPPLNEVGANHKVACFYPLTSVA